MRFVSFVLISVLGSLISGASMAEDALKRLPYPLLAINGVHLKWGEPRYAAPATVTYAFADRLIDRPSSRNCRSMRPLPAAMAVPFVHEVRAAFRAWEKVANITFEQVTDTAEAEILVGMQASPRGIAFADVHFGAPAAPPARVARLRQAAVCFSPAVRWTTSFDGDPKTYDIRYVSLHEIGHAIGLDHAGSHASAIMSYRYSETYRLPQPDDVAVIQHLYGAPSFARATGDFARADPQRNE